MDVLAKSCTLRTGKIKIKMKTIITVVLSILMTVSLALAAPKPFGLEIGKTTEKEVRNNYTIVAEETNKYSDGAMLDIDPSSMDFSGLQLLSTIFSKNGKLLSVIVRADQHRYDDVLRGLKEKYRLISEKNPFVGDREATFSDENVTIRLGANHLAFTLTIIYIDNEFNSKFQEKTSIETNQKIRNENSQL